MDFIEAVAKTDRLLSLIRRSATGRPEHLARLLNVDRRTALRYIAQLKDAGLPITFCHTRESYVFTKQVKYEFKVMVDEAQLLSVKGGAKAMQNFSRVTKNGTDCTELCIGTGSNANVAGFNNLTLG